MDAVVTATMMTTTDTLAAITGSVLEVGVIALVGGMIIELLEGMITELLERMIIALVEG